MNVLQKEQALTLSELEKIYQQSFKNCFTGVLETSYAGICRKKNVNMFFGGIHLNKSLRSLWSPPPFEVKKIKKL